MGSAPSLPQPFYGVSPSLQGDTEHPLGVSNPSTHCKTFALATECDQLIGPVPTDPLHQA
eukprot:1423646-Amphidinium_carterae.2